MAVDGTCHDGVAEVDRGQDRADRQRDHRSAAQHAGSTSAVPEIDEEAHGAEVLPIELRASSGLLAAVNAAVLIASMCRSSETC